MVLIDGVKLNDPSSAERRVQLRGSHHHRLSRQIEVLRGPQSTLRGSQAIGGVVNIVTPVPEGPLSGAVSAEGGTHETAILRGLCAGWRRSLRLARRWQLCDQRRHLCMLRVIAAVARPMVIGMLVSARAHSAHHGQRHR